MAREKIERRALPAPVLHDLAGQFDEIPRDRGSREAAHFDAAQHMMQQMPELVEDGLHFAMRQQRGFVADRRSQIAADAARMRLETAGSINAGDEAFHPGAVALRFARIPVGVERAHQRAVADRELRSSGRRDATRERHRAASPECRKAARQSQTFPSTTRSAGK